MSIKIKMTLPNFLQKNGKKTKTMATRFVGVTLTDKKLLIKPNKLI